MSKTTKIHKGTERYFGRQLKNWRWDQDTGMRVLRSFAQLRGARGFTKDEALKVLEWAGKMEFYIAYLDLVKAGKIGVDVRDDGEVTFWPIPPTTQPYKPKGDERAK